jgi:hypothetical protein
MGEVSAGDGAQLERQQRDDGYGFIGERHKLHFIAGAALMDMDNRTDIAGLQSVFGQVVRQYDAIVLLDQGVCLLFTP